LGSSSGSSEKPEFWRSGRPCGRPARRFIAARSSLETICKRWFSHSTTSRYLPRVCEGVIDEQEVEGKEVPPIDLRDSPNHSLLGSSETERDSAAVDVVSTLANRDPAAQSIGELFLLENGQECL